MKAFYTLSKLSLLLLFVSTVDARKDPGEYWRNVMKDQPMPESIHGLVDHVGSISAVVSDDKKADCHTSESALEHKEEIQEKSFVKDFEPRPNVSAYHDDDDTKAVLTNQEKSFVKDFEPRPNLSVYHNDDVAAGVKEQEKSFVNDFEPRPNLSVYNE